MSRTIEQILRLCVPIVVRLGERTMKLSEILALVPGSIIELSKNSEEELELLVNNQTVAAGSAVKVGENFGIKLSSVGPQARRVAALGARPLTTVGNDDAVDAEKLAESMLSGQM